jgi:hypothetical protein
MPEDNRENPAEPGSAAAPEGIEGQAGAKGEGRPRKSLSDRATSTLRAARRSEQEVSDPEERATFLLAEANVFALLELADALRGWSPSD